MKHTTNNALSISCASAQQTPSLHWANEKTEPCHGCQAKNWVQFFLKWTLGNTENFRISRWCCKETLFSRRQAMRSLQAALNLTVLRFTRFDSKKQTTTPYRFRESRTRWRIQIQRTYSYFPSLCKTNIWQNSQLPMPCSAVSCTSLLWRCVILNIFVEAVMPALPTANPRLLHQVKEYANIVVLPDCHCLRYGRFFILNTF